MTLMANLWPWLAVAGVGALHGLSPTSGWMFAAACGVHAGNGAQARRALLPIAAGHTASAAALAGTVALGVPLDRAWVQWLAGALLVAAALHRGLRGPLPRALAGTRAGHAAIATWTFLIATTQGAGLMLVPAFAPLCLGSGPARTITASGSLLLASAALALHTTAMLLTTGLVAAGVCRGVARLPQRHGAVAGRTALRRLWTAALALTGAVLMAWR